MTRQSIDDGGWFDLDSATGYSEDTRWDGFNMVSKVTGTPWDHERLFITRRGIYILYHWSQREGSRDRYVRIDAREAADWLTRNDHEAPSSDAALTKAVVSAEV